MAFPGSQWRNDNYGPPQQQQQSYYPPPSNSPYQPPSYGPPSGYDQQNGYHTGSGGYQPQFQPPPFAPPQTYGQQQGAPPPQYQNMPVHYQPSNQQQGGQGQPFFQYSQCTGKRKALLIGINYTGSRNALKGCHNDALNMQKFIQSNYNFRSEDTVILLDSPNSTARQIPTRDNILTAMQWLVRGAQPNDSLFFHYSGHGGQTKDLDGDEDDGNDEVIYPLDFERAGHIVDDIMHDIMVRPLPPGCRLTAIFDSCHSATALDLPYIYSTQGVIKEPNLLAEAGQGALGAAQSYLRGDMGGVFSAISGVAKQAMNGGKAEQITKQTKTSPADAISWSGCKDSQTSADTQEAGKATGAMSYAFITSLSRNPQQSYLQLLNTIRDELQGRYSQKPQLSASHPMDTNLLFVM